MRRKTVLKNETSMKLLTKSIDYEETVKLCENMNEEYNKPVIFHCYWNGNLNEKHLISIKSCYYFNILNNKHKIIIWLENSTPNTYTEQIKKYAEIKIFNLNEEKKDTFLENIKLRYNRILSYYSDVVRYVILYKHGGCWFDLDILFLRNFDSLFFKYEKEICVYQWQDQPYPNGAIYISLESKSKEMEDVIRYIMKRGRGWGFQEAMLTYNLPLNMLVLPCSWFDPGFIRTPYRLGPKKFFINNEKDITFENFHKGVFCYHWHGRWNDEVEERSPFRQLANIIEEKLV